MCERESVVTHVIHTGANAIPQKTSRGASQAKAQLHESYFKGCSPPPPPGKGTISAVQGIGSVQGIRSSCTVWGGNVTSKAQVKRVTVTTQKLFAADTCMTKVVLS